MIQLSGCRIGKLEIESELNYYGFKENRKFY